MAEIIIPTRAYQLAKDQKVNKYTESRYGVVHDLGMLLKQRAFLTSVRTSTKNGQIKELLDALYSLQRWLSWLWPMHREHIEAK